MAAYASTVTYDTLEEYLDMADQCLEARMADEIVRKGRELA